MRLGDQHQPQLLTLRPLRQNKINEFAKEIETCSSMPDIDENEASEAVEQIRAKLRTGGTLRCIRTVRRDHTAIVFTGIETHPRAASGSTLSATNALVHDNRHH
jgi:hypothetical protein